MNRLDRLREASLERYGKSSHVRHKKWAYGAALDELHAQRRTQRRALRRLRWVRRTRGQQ